MEASLEVCSGGLKRALPFSEEGEGPEQGQAQRGVQVQGVGLLGE